MWPWKFKSQKILKTKDMDVEVSRGSNKNWFRFSLFGQVYVERNGNQFTPHSSKTNSRKELRIIFAPFEEFSRVELWHMSSSPPGLSQFIGTGASAPEHFTQHGSTSGSGPFFSKPLSALKKIRIVSDNKFVELTFHTVPEVVGANPYSSFVSDMVYTNDMAIKDVSIVRLSEHCKDFSATGDHVNTSLEFLWKNMHLASTGKPVEITKDSGWSWLQAVQKHIIRFEVEMHHWGSRKSTVRARDRFAPQRKGANHSKIEDETLDLEDYEDEFPARNTKSKQGPPKLKPQFKQSGIFAEFAAVQRAGLDSSKILLQEPNRPIGFVEGKAGRVASNRFEDRPAPVLKSSVMASSSFQVSGPVYDDFVCYDRHSNHQAEVPMIRSDSEDSELEMLQKITKSLKQGRAATDRRKQHIFPDDNEKPEKRTLASQERHMKHAVEIVDEDRKSRPPAKEKYTGDHSRSRKPLPVTEEIDLTATKPVQSKNKNTSKKPIEVVEIGSDKKLPKLSKLQKGYEAPKNVFCRFPETEYIRLLSYLCPVSQLRLSMVSYALMRAVAEKIRRVELRPGAFACWKKHHPHRAPKLNDRVPDLSLSTGRIYLGRYSLEEISITSSARTADGTQLEISDEAWEAWFEKVVISCSRLKRLALPWTQLTNRTLSVIRRKVSHLESLTIISQEPGTLDGEKLAKCRFDESKLVELFEEQTSLKHFEIYTLGVDILKMIQTKADKSTILRELEAFHVEFLRMPFQLGLNNLSVLSKTSPNLKSLQIPWLMLQKPLPTKPPQDEVVPKTEYEPPKPWTTHLVSLGQVDLALPSKLLFNLQVLWLSPVFTSFTALTTCIFPALKKLETLILNIEGTDPGPLVEETLVKLLELQARTPDDPTQEGVCPRLKHVVVFGVKDEDQDIVEELTREILSEHEAKVKSRKHTLQTTTSSWWSLSSDPSHVLHDVIGLPSHRPSPSLCLLRSVQNIAPLRSKRG